MLISQEWFTTMIIIAVFIPIISVIALFMIMGYEKEFRLMKVKQQNVELEKDFQQSKYMQLNAQIQPHFLFNTINLILGYARLDEKRQLVNTIENFSQYLRFSYQVQDQLIPLSMEFEQTKKYLAIQQARFESYLTIEYEVDSEVYDALVPPYTLQTLTENAFKHGLEKKAGEKYLKILLKNDDTRLVIQVIDNGVGINLKQMEATPSGHGLDNIQRRLMLLFGKENVNLLVCPSDTGTTASVSFPLQTNKSGEEHENTPS
ncbi:sensor histidine kinase [Salinibacillus xinjiangensis]|uniref:Sensor histidine kinase n=1 Tax=Salinibacillus xinjiangensis TaxID=1229268 RepID=A0A6G1XA51_9BACI|nr:histidine kinase [Salinibacillus xinjiangensis]MRG87883.1 sensor histidine kinase [Salinibacillus xinjiangensis]